MLPKLIGICGRAGCGKDTLANCIVARYNIHEIHHLADPIKNALNEMFGWRMSQWDDREWKETVIPEYGVSPRYLAQTLGTEWGRDIIAEDLWLRIAKERHKQYVYTIVPDVRFENEARWIVEDGGVLIHVIRPSQPEIPGSGHASENVDSLLEYVTFKVINGADPADMVVLIDEAFKRFT